MCCCCVLDVAAARSSSRVVWCWWGAAVPCPRARGVAGTRTAMGAHGHALLCYCAVACIDLSHCHLCTDTLPCGHSLTVGVRVTV